MILDLIDHPRTECTYRSKSLLVVCRHHVVLCNTGAYGTHTRSYCKLLCLMRLLSASRIMYTYQTWIDSGCKNESITILISAIDPCLVRIADSGSRKQAYTVHKWPNKYITLASVRLVSASRILLVLPYRDVKDALLQHARSILCSWSSTLERIRTLTPSLALFLSLVEHYSALRDGPRRPHYDVSTRAGQIY